MRQWGNEVIRLYVDMPQGRRRCDVGTRGFEGLEAWQKARQLTMAVHKHVVPLLPPEEKWDLSKQIRTSSKSVMTGNEGMG